MDALDAILQASDVVAVFAREVAVRLVDISVSGVSSGERPPTEPGRDGDTARQVRGQKSSWTTCG